MLYNLPEIINPDLLWVLASMGHGDDIAVVDRNFPAQSVALRTQTQRLVHIDGVDTPGAIAAILRLFPLDDFVPAPVTRIEVVGEPETILPVHEEVARIVARIAPRAAIACLERHAFYAAAARSYAVVQTTEDRPYGCYILKKGVIFPEGVGPRGR